MGNKSGLTPKLAKIVSVRQTLLSLLDHLQVAAIYLIGCKGVESVNQAKYVLTFRETTTVYGETRLIPSNSEVSNVMVKLCTFFETQTVKLVTFICGDNGGELTYKAF
ncbi:uncharacterized protein VP01_2908g3 [Puccinia sorghi]|uniref:Integrase catalytic domain-containing protein n=1 Tax=Puccinia sorghi TaxID=27349 RepID=A0A0L6V254_9BASI|nr:uncharacterized protein VP01_2908g3 [Puccinia sorghi]